MSAEESDVGSFALAVTSDSHERMDVPAPTVLSGVEPSDPISHFGTFETDHISQFTSADSFVHVSAEDGSFSELQDSNMFAESSVPHAHLDAESVDSGEMRRIFTRTDRLHGHGALGSAGSAGTSSMDVAGAVEVSPNLEHASALTAFNMSLPSSTPKFFWETDGFLSAVFGGETSVVDQLFKPVPLKRPAPFYVDLSHKDDVEAPIVKALRKGASRPI